MFPGHPDPNAFVSGIRLCGESEEIAAGAKTGFQLCGLPVTWFKEWSGPPKRGVRSRSPKSAPSYPVPIIQ